ncbi:MAG: 3-deoxy-7-phosphoheptulonate synthase [bacterium]|nr:3-deoxy-7-phosphoheptulonate synthase [bacterium]
MIVILKNGCTAEDIDYISIKIKEMGYTPHIIEGIEKAVIGAVGNEKNQERLKSLITVPCVEKILPVLQPYKLASRTTKNEDSIVKVERIMIGGGNFVIIGGPCSVESLNQTMAAARAVKKSGGHLLRGGAYKPRTSPYSFQGLEEEGLKILKTAKKATDLPVVTELLSDHNTDLVASYADIIQIGARNMQNFALLRAAGQSKVPVILKRGMASTLEELLMSAEYILSEGNYDVILCERGIRTFEKAYRNTLDLAAVPTLKKMSHLPVIVDPSHGTGRRDLILPMSKAAIAAGADGLIIEVHPEPEKAYSDGPQSLTPDEFSEFMEEIKPFIEASGKKMSLR